MGRPRKNKSKTAPEQPEQNEIADVGVPGLFSPQEWDIQEELMGNEALLELQRERRGDF